MPALYRTLGQEGGQDGLWETELTYRCPGGPPDKKTWRQLLERPNTLNLEIRKQTQRVPAKA